MKDSHQMMLPPRLTTLGEQGAIAAATNVLPLKAMEDCLNGSNRYHHNRRILLLVYGSDTTHDIHST